MGGAAPDRAPGGELCGLGRLRLLHRLQRRCHRHRRQYRGHRPPVRAELRCHASPVQPAARPADLARAGADVRHSAAGARPADRRRHPHRRCPQHVARHLQRGDVDRRSPTTPPSRTPPAISTATASSSSSRMPASPRTSMSRSSAPATSASRSPMASPARPRSPMPSCAPCTNTAARSATSAWIVLDAGRGRRHRRADGNRPHRLFRGAQERLARPRIPRRQPDVA